MKIINKVAEAKDFLERAAFKISSGADLTDAHRKIIKALVSLEEVERMLSEKNSSALSEQDEVSKVTRRLKLWAKRPEQINTRILKAFLTLSVNSDSPISELKLKEAVGESNFETNFVQMKNIADKNHGKVFDISGDIVSIWPPVASAVEDFRKATLG